MLSQLDLAHAQMDDGTPKLVQISHLDPLTITFQAGDNISASARETLFCVHTTNGGLFDISINAPNFRIGRKDISYDYLLSSVDATGVRTRQADGTVSNAPETITAYNLPGNPDQFCENSFDNMRFVVTLTDESATASLTGSATAKITYTVMAQ
jgi:hypothetical protein